jgi:anti-sigma B factor antagonist
MPSDPTYEPFHCEVHPQREAVRIRPVGELDIATVPAVDDQLAELQSVGFSQLTLDLRAVPFLDSTGLRLILEWDARSRLDGFAFSVVPGPPAVQRLFDLTGATERIAFCDGSCAPSGRSATGPPGFPAFRAG